jgi:hypothetical protein
MEPEKGLEPQPDPQGDWGESIVRRDKPRGDLRMLEAAIRNGWAIPAIAYEALPKLVIDIALNAKGERERLAAVRALTTMHKDNVDTFSVADRAARLDDGLATERIELAPIRLQSRD